MRVSLGYIDFVVSQQPSGEYCEVGLMMSHLIGTLWCTGTNSYQFSKANW